jgi:hypothetical protein
MNDLPNVARSKNKASRKTRQLAERKLQVELLLLLFYTSSVDYGFGGWWAGGYWLGRDDWGLRNL